MSLLLDTPLERRQPLFFFYWCGDHRDLHSFPTRRSSDLKMVLGQLAAGGRGQRLRYRRFVEEGIGRAHVRTSVTVRSRTLPGTESLTQQVLDRVQGNGRERREMHRQLRSARPVALPEKII